MVFFVCGERTKAIIGRGFTSFSTVCGLSIPCFSTCFTDLFFSVTACNTAAIFTGWFALFVRNRTDGARLFIVCTRGTIKSCLENVISERNALEERDVPIFYGKASEKGIRDNEKLLYADYFQQSALENAQELIRKLDKKAQQLQLDLIKTLLAMHRASVHENKLIAPSSTVLHYSENITDEHLLQEAWRIYQEMIP